MNAMTSAKPVEYFVVAGDVRGDRGKFMDVCRNNFRGAVDRFDAKYDWFYLGCPWGAPLLEAVCHGTDADWVGVAAIGPRRMLLDGREIRAGELVDLLVDSKHRSLGPALMLQHAIFERALAEFDLIYGFPNPKALPVVKRVGYASFPDIVRASRVLRHAPYLQRMLPRPLARIAGFALDLADRCGEAWRWLAGSRLVSSWSNDVTPRMQELWNRTRPARGLASVRDNETLGWRFTQAAFNHARFLEVGAVRGGPLTAWFACQGDGATLHVRDFWSADATTGLSRKAIHALIRAGRAAGYAVISVESASTNGALSTWRAARFMPRSRRPIVGAWSPRVPEAARTGSIHLSPADEDE
ncbi:MAG TPA: hypothetical protein VKB52_13190 [Rhodanobacteraceae bacterium]|nr:hypothetical protein [Rhodanobacteraceae bacterium]